MKKSRFTSRYNQFLAALRQARKDAGLTQTQVGKKFGAHASFVSKCESGERRVDVIELAEFCRIYGLALNEFLERANLH
ncbi:MAG: helix-turn-helix transcriptional regulator [Planctomycetaceae bacterium]|nr:helix-turn-helix transcriptional regulator [Planctomycetaceae bacterium]